MTASRQLTITSQLHMEEGEKTVSFTQSLIYSNKASYQDDGWIQVRVSLENLKSVILIRLNSRQRSRQLQARPLGHTGMYRSSGMPSNILLQYFPTILSMKLNLVQLVHTLTRSNTTLIAYFSGRRIQFGYPPHTY